jgi:hypothetical protein
MNACTLLNAYDGESFPDTIQCKFDKGVYGCVSAFNHAGTLLAIGNLDGSIVIIDFDTR